MMCVTQVCEIILHKNPYTPSLSLSLFILCPLSSFTSLSIMHLSDLYLWNVCNGIFKKLKSQN